MTHESDNPQFDHLINNMDSDEVPQKRRAVSPAVFYDLSDGEYREWNRVELDVSDSGPGQP